MGVHSIIVCLPTPLENHYLILYSSHSLCGGQGTWLTRKSRQMNGPVNHSHHKLLYRLLLMYTCWKDLPNHPGIKRNPPYAALKLIILNCLGAKGMEKLCVTVVALLVLMYSSGGFCYTLPDIPLSCKCAWINSSGRNGNFPVKLRTKTKRFCFHIEIPPVAYISHNSVCLTASVNYCNLATKLISYTRKAIVSITCLEWSGLMSMQTLNLVLGLGMRHSTIMQL